MAVYLVKGVGAYVSTYLMTDIGQRVVRDLRDQLFRHILDQSATFFSRRTTGQLMSRITNDVNQVQQAVSETIGDLLREGLSADRLRGLMLFFKDARLALVCRDRRAARRLSAGPARATASGARRARARRSSSTCRT